MVVAAGSAAVVVAVVVLSVAVASVAAVVAVVVAVVAVSVALVSVVCVSTAAVSDEEETIVATSFPAAAVRAAPVKKRKVKRKVVAMRRRGGAFFSGSRGRRRSTCTRRGPSGSPRLVGQKTSPSSSSPASVSSVPWSRPGCVARPDRSSSSRLRAGPRLFLIYGSPSFKSAPRSRSARIAICSQPRWDFHTMQSRKPLTVPPMR